MVSQQIGIVRGKKLDFALADDLVGLAQMHQRFVEAAHGIRVIHLRSGVDLAVVVCHTDPRRSGGKTGILAAVPLHRGVGITSGTPPKKRRSSFPWKNDLRFFILNLSPKSDG